MKFGKSLKRVSGGANDIGYPFAKGKDSPQSYKSGCRGVCLKSSSTWRSTTAKSTSRVAVVKVGTRELSEVLLDHLPRAFRRSKAHPGDRSEMNVRVYEARNEKLSFSRNHRCSGLLLRPF